MKLFNYQLNNLPDYDWDNDLLMVLLGKARNIQGRLMGKMASLDIELSQQANLETLTLEVVKSAEIEGEILDSRQVRSSISKGLGINIHDPVRVDEFTNNLSGVILEATLDFESDLTTERLLMWSRSLLLKGNLNDDFFSSKSSNYNEEEINKFIVWYNSEDSLDPLIKAGIAHLWFANLHSFYKYNGIIARNISKMILSKSDERTFMFYSMSDQISLDIKNYKYILEMTQRGLIDVTTWLQWFLNCFIKAINSSEQILGGVLLKQSFWSEIQLMRMNVRQKKILDILRKDNKIIITSLSWAKQTHCSADTALRDIQNLIKKNILKKDRAGGRSTCYMLFSEIS